MKKVVIILLVLVAIVAIGFKARGLMKKREQEIINEPLPQKEQVAVSLTKAKRDDMKEFQQFLAVVQADKSIKISTKMAGYIKNIFVDESQHVKKDTLLATIDDNDINSNISLLETTLLQQKNDLALAQQIYHRNQKLYQVGGLAKEQLDTSKVIMQGKVSAINATKQKIIQLKEQKDYLSIKAPFEGDIDTLLMHKGDLAVAGKPILTMSNGDKKLVFSFVAEKDSIKKFQYIYNNGKKIGQIDKILNIAKQGLVQAEVKLTKDINLPLGATINIDVLTQDRKGCIVPSNTLLHKKDGVYIVAYKDGKFSPLKVNTIMNQNNEVMITPCPNGKIAKGSEVLLSKLPVYGDVDIID